MVFSVSYIDTFSILVIANKCQIRQVSVLVAGKYMPLLKDSRLLITSITAFVLGAEDQLTRMSRFSCSL